MAEDPTTLIEIRTQLATLVERSTTTNRRLDAIEAKLNALGDMEQRITKVETNQGIIGAVNAALAVIAGTVAGWLGMKN